MMKNLLLRLPLIATILLCSGIRLEASTGTPDGEADLAPAHALITRVVGPRASAFVVERLESANGIDRYELEAEHGTVTLRGNSAGSVARAFHDYLRNALHAQVTWSGEHLDLPPVMPDLPRKSVESPYRFRLYYNVCAFGYSTAFWDWERWERELDWMALHGVNMPLAMSGQEAIWRKVWNGYGVTDDELKEFFSGPAFLPWHRMGNLNKHDGPLPQGWLDQSRELQKRILRRMRELGMTPVVPAFAGFVPPSFRAHHPDAEVKDMAPWVGFTESYGTHMLSPRSPYFVEIGKRFIREYEKEYGDCAYYLSDSFNEMEVPVSKEHRYTELAEFGEAVYRSIHEADSAGTWVMQGWLFYNRSRFWDTLSTQALLSRIPNDKMIIIDLANELWQGWRAQRAFHGKQWIYSVIHNFGGNNPLFGPMKFFAEDASKALHDPGKGNLVGFGISPEGIENNEVIYELLTDAAWTERPIDLTRWLRAYSVSRYGACPSGLDSAWQLLLGSVYTEPMNNVRFGFQERPTLDPGGEAAGGPELDRAVRLFLACAPELSRSELYRNDVVDLVTQLAGKAADRYLRSAGSAQRDGMTADRDRSLRSAMEILDGIDRLLDTRADTRLARWIGDARYWGETEAEKDYYERDAKRQVTVWGGSDELSEYAAKVWSGLVRGYYAKRWELFYAHLGDKTPFDMKAWEESWITTSGNVPDAAPNGDPFATASALLQTIDRLDAVYAIPVRARTAFDSSAMRLRVSLEPEFGNMEVRYRLDGSQEWKTYNAPFTLSASALLEAAGFRSGERFGKELRTEIQVHQAFGKNVQLARPYSPKYTAGGRYGLTDCVYGSNAFYDGKWQGFQGEDLEAVIDLGRAMPVHAVGINCLENTASWIFFPSAVECSLSEDGKEFLPCGSIANEREPSREGAAIRRFSLSAEGKTARYVKVKARNFGALPAWHAGAGSKAWLFADEIVVE